MEPGPRELASELRVPLRLIELVPPPVAEQQPSLQPFAQRDVIGFEERLVGFARHPRAVQLGADRAATAIMVSSSLRRSTCSSTASSLMP